MILTTEAGEILETGVELGEGTDGFVYSVRSDPYRCVKVYRQNVPDNMDRLDALLDHEFTPLAQTRFAPHLAWPQGTVVDTNGERCGFVMPLLDTTSWHPISDLFHPAERLRLLGALNDWVTLVQVAERLADLMAQLHRCEIAIGDISDSNVLVSRTGQVCLLDCDSFGFFTVDGRPYAPPRVSPTYCPPPSVTDPVRVDEWVLATITVRLLLCGNHPFDGYPVGWSDDDDPPGPSGNATAGRHILTTVPSLEQSANVVEPAVLSRGIRRLARRTFGDYPNPPDGGSASALEWSSELGRVARYATACSVNPRHRYDFERPRCPWCAFRERADGDHFPSPGIPSQRNGGISTGDGSAAGPAPGAATVPGWQPAPIASTLVPPVSVGPWAAALGVIVAVVMVLTWIGK